MKIGVGLAHQGSVKTPTALSLAGLLAETSHPLYLMAQAGCYVHENRTKLAQGAIAAGCTHLFFLDSDIQCPADTIERLLAHEKPIVGAMYNVRGELPRVNTIKFVDEAGKPKAVAAEDIPREVFACYAIPTGAMLIDVAVFHRMPPPWFWFEHEDGMVTVGEDVWFCREAQKAGFTVWCDPTIPIAHIGDFGY